MSNDISAQEAEAAKLNDLTGMDVPKEDILNDQSDANSDTTQTINSKTDEEEPDKGKPASKPDEKKGDDKKNAEDEGKKNNRSDRPAHGERALKAVFSQINDLREQFKAVDEIRGLVKGLQDAISKRDTTETVDEIAEFAKGNDLDADQVKGVVEFAKKQIMAELEKSGKLNKDLPDDVKEKLKALDQLQADAEADKEVAHFENEWSSFLVNLEKTYPNAKAAEKAEAKKLMDDLAHSKEFKDKELDYVWWKNQSKFDTILKIAKGSKSGEESSKQLEDDDGDGEIDLDPENMTPDKMKAHDKKKMSAKSDPVQVIG